MEEIKTKGIVISAKDFKDSDKLVTIFSFDFGVIRADDNVKKLKRPPDAEIPPQPKPKHEKM